MCQKVKNFFLSFFGQSDWQKTLRAADNTIYKQIRADLVNAGHNNKELNKIIYNIKKQTSSILKKSNNQTLINLVKKQNNQTISQQEKDKLSDLENKFSDKVRGMLESLEPQEKIPQKLWTEEEEAFEKLRNNVQRIQEDEAFEKMWNNVPSENT